MSRHRSGVSLARGGKVKLTSQEKLALAMTSAGSMRNLAALIGVSHQKIGRWLREGERGGAKSIPNDKATREAIDLAFQIHKEISKEQAEIENVPFLGNTPLFPVTKPRRDGKPSDRVFIPETPFIRGETRVKIMEQAAKTKKFMSVTVESEIEAQSYLEELADKEIAAGKFKGKSKKWIVRHLKKVLTKSGVIGNTETLKLYTKRQPLGPIWVDGKPKWDDPYEAANAVEDEIQRRHAPSANQPGGTLASSFIFQLAPKLNTQAPTNAKPKARKSKWSNKRGK